jgi:exodeoxyribonuclease VIII
MTVMEKTTFKPGIYPGMSFEDYAAIDAINCSRLAWLKGSAAHLKAVMDGRLEREDTKALGFGRALHVRLLEPDTYAERVKIKGTCVAILKSGNRTDMACGKSAKGMVDGHWCCGTHGGDESTLDAGYEYLTQDEADRIERAVAALKDRKIDNLRRARGMFEVVMVAEIAGVPCKVRLDKYIESPCAIVDVKKVAAPKSPGTVIGSEDFERRIASYGYGFIAAMYCDVVKELTGKMPRWYWMTIEDDEPFTPSLYRASDECLQAGRTEYLSMLHTFKTCRDGDCWPGPADEPVLLDGPKWWLTKNGL